MRVLPPPPDTTTVVQPTRTYSKFEDTIAYDGCVIPEHGQATAFLDDRSQNRVYQLHVGQQIANGVIAGITFDGLQYRVGVKMTVIPPAHFLNGLPSTDYEQADVVVPDVAPTPDSTGAPMSAADQMLAKLRQRRLAEQGGPAAVAAAAANGGATGPAAAPADPNAPPIDETPVDNPPADQGAGGGADPGAGNGN
jgi:hypothetical protein